MTVDSLFQTYNRIPLSFEKGDGAWLEGSDGRRYLDMGSGIAVTALGHGHPHLVGALKAAAEKVWHTSNLFRVPEQERLAARLADATFADRVFFCNSGAEANEAAIKTARRYHWVHGAPERTRIVTFEGAFHGRTLATIAAGGSPKYLEGFGEPLSGFDQVPKDDVEAVRRVVGDETAAIMVEPIQGEGGIRVVERETLRALRDIADEHGILLIFDEVQTGIGRLGTLFAYQTAGVAPDILSSAKGLGGGFPIGATLATEEAAKGLAPGTHGTTYGGNALACAASNAVLDVILEDGFLAEVRRKGAFASQRLASVVESHPHVFSELRGEGLMLGLKCTAPIAEVVSAARAHGLLTVPAGDATLRLLPPLIARDEDIAEAADRLDAAATDVEQASREAATA